MAQVASEALRGFASPIRFPSATPSAPTGLACIVHGLRGPTLALTLPVPDGVGLALALSAAWLSRGVVDYALIAYRGFHPRWSAARRLCRALPGDGTGCRSGARRADPPSSSRVTMNESSVELAGVSLSSIQAFLDRIQDLTDSGPVEQPVEQLAASWRAHGLRPGDVVLLCLPNGAGLLAHVFAVLLARGVPALVSPSSPAARQQALVEALPARALVAMRRPAPQAQDVERFALGRAEVALFSEALPPGAQPGEMVLLTSGTSGFASGCVFDLEALFRNARRHADAIGLRAGDTRAGGPPALLFVLDGGAGLRLAAAGRRPRHPRASVPARRVPADPGRARHHRLRPDAAPGALAPPAWRALPGGAALPGRRWGRALPGARGPTAPPAAPGRAVPHLRPLGGGPPCLDAGGSRGAAAPLRLRGPAAARGRRCRWLPACPAARRSSSCPRTR